MSFKISLAQYPILFHTSKTAWVESIKAWFTQASLANSSLLVFPEYGSLDLTSVLSEKAQKDLALQLNELQTLHDLFLQTFIEQAKAHKVYVVAPSWPIKIEDKFYNRSYFIAPSGKYDFQDKLHMTRFENEEWHISASETELKVFNTALGKIALQICFDIEFPWASSLLAQQGVQLVIAPSCTEGIAGMNRVHIAARARALENQFYVAISQTVGEALWSPAVDINTGMASLYVPSDRPFPNDGIIAQGNLNENQWLHTEIDFEKINSVRTNGQVFNHKANNDYPWDASKRKNFTLKLIDLI